MRRRDILLAGLGTLAAATSAHAQGLDDYRWKNRPLLVFAPIKTDPRLALQRQRLVEVAGALVERDMVVIEVVQNLVYVQGRPSFAFDADRLRQSYRVSAVDFATILIGKDGGVKMRSGEPMVTADLFATIDAMPMRRQEMGGD
jgi:hypothetical protein